MGEQTRREARKEWFEMALQNDGSAPYTSPSSLIQVIEGFRNRGLQTPFTHEVLIKAGVSEGLAPRTLQALKQLDLVDANGEPSPELRALQRAPDDEFKPRFADLIRSAYAPIFAYADPTSDPPGRVRDAFRGYTPVGQQARMVTLFLGLCEFAGIIEGVADKRATTLKPHGSRGPRRPNQQVEIGQAQERNTAIPMKAALGSRGHRTPPTLLALLEEALPEPGQGWTEQRRDRFLETFKILLDFSVSISETVPSDQEVM